MRSCLKCLPLVLILATFAARAGAPRDPYQFFFETGFGDFAEELQRASAENKKGVLLFFEMDDCPFCHRMKSTVLNQPRVQDFYREHFLCFTVDIEGQVEVVDFQGRTLLEHEFATVQNRVRATPVFAFYDLQGQLVQRYTGAASGIDEFMWLGEFVAQGLYAETNFTRYKRARKRSAGQ